MRRCLELARAAHADGDAPVGSVITRDGRIVSEGVEAVRATGDVTAHAEMAALRAACATLGRDLSGCVLYTTVEPCVMCAYAIRLARIELVVAGTRSPASAGAVDGPAVLADPEMLPTRPLVALLRGVLEDECRALLSLR